MYRSALCIKMLNLLKSRGLMSRAALAEELQTNVRNISEFRKELEIAGYYIESIPGVYGGYQLNEAGLLPVPLLSSTEKRGIKEASKYLQSHPEFRYLQDFQGAMDKIQAGIHDVDMMNDVYLQEKGILSDKIQGFLNICEQGIQDHHEVIIQYKSMRAKAFEEVRIHPYEILNYHQAYYCLAYSLKAKAYRVYKFSSERMSNCKISDHVFIRDQDFRLKDHIGESGLINNQLHELDLLIHGEEAVFICEQPPGIHHDMNWVNSNTLHIHMFMEGDVAVRMFLLSLGDHVEILAPKQWRKQIVNIAQEIVKQEE